MNITDQDHSDHEGDPMTKPAAPTNDAGFRHANIDGQLWLVADDVATALTMFAVGGCVAGEINKEGMRSMLVFATTLHEYGAEALSTATEYVKKES